MESLPKTFSWKLLLMGVYCAWGRYRSERTCRAIVADNTVFPWLCLVCACLFFSQMLLWKKGIFLKMEIDSVILNKGNWKCGNDWSGCHNGQPFSCAFCEQGQGILKVLQHWTVLHKENWFGPFTNASGANFEKLGSGQDQWQCQEGGVGGLASTGLQDTIKNCTM